MPFDDTIFIKKKVNILSLFSEDQLRKITTDLERNVYKSGQTVIFQGEVAQNFYIIKSGRVEVYSKKDGDRLPLGEMGPGDFFGEVSMLEPSAAIATVKAMENETEILKITHESFQILLKERPDLEKALRERIAEHRQKKSGAMKKEGA